MNEKGIVPLVIAGWIAVVWIIGVGVADFMEPPAWPRYGNSASWCRPHPYDKLAWKPWPFRRGRYEAKAHEGDTDICTGEQFRGGAWIK